MVRFRRSNGAGEGRMNSLQQRPEVRFADCTPSPLLHAAPAPEPAPQPRAVCEASHCSSCGFSRPSRMPATRTAAVTGAQQPRAVCEASRGCCRGFHPPVANACHPHGCCHRRRTASRRLRGFPWLLPRIPSARRECPATRTDAVTGAEQPRAVCEASRGCCRGFHPPVANARHPHGCCHRRRTASRRLRGFPWLLPRIPSDRRECRPTRADGIDTPPVARGRWRGSNDGPARRQPALWPRRRLPA